MKRSPVQGRPRNALAAAGSHTSDGQAQAQLAWSEAQASSAQANVASAEAASRKAAADLERMKVLAEERIVPAAAARCVRGRG